MGIKIALMSDLHLEQSRDGGLSFIQEHDTQDAELLILAGDIFSPRTPRVAGAVFEGFLARGYKQIIYIPGNHEFWGKSVEQTWANLYDSEDLCPSGHVQVLDKDSCMYKSLRIYGGTGWFPRTRMSKRLEHLWCDFEYIQGFEPYDENAEFRSCFDIKADIVVSHHAPHANSIQPRWRHEATNCYYKADFEDLIEKFQPAYWLHGHMHDQFDYMLGNTKVICHPRGYSSERAKRPEYKAYLIDIEICEVCGRPDHACICEDDDD